MRKLDIGQKIATAGLAVIGATLLGGLGYVGLGSRTMTPAQIKAELATEPSGVRAGTLDYLQSPHETMILSYAPGDPVTRNRFRQAVRDARDRLERSAEEASYDRSREQQRAALREIASQPPTEAPRRPTSHD